MRTKCFLAMILCTALLLGNISIISAAAPLDIGLNVSTNANMPQNGDYFDVAASFDTEASTNAATVVVTYDKSKFEYAGNLGGDENLEQHIEGVKYLDTVTGDGNVKLTLMISGYNAKDLINLRFRTKDDAILENGSSTIGVYVEFAYRSTDGSKSIESVNSSVTFNMSDGLPEVVTLIDLSNVIDLFNVAEGDELWSKAKFFDFNKNGVIDISDIVYVAQRVVIGFEPNPSGEINPITFFPEPESFTELLYSLPNPFISWEGTEVTPEDWPARSAQLKQIMEHYMYGYMPSTDGITVSLEVTRPQSSYTAASGAGAAQVTVYKDGVAAPTKINLSFFLPDPSNPKFPPPADGYPVVYNCSSSVGNFWRLADEYGIGVIGINVANIDSGDNETGSYKGNNRAGVVNELFKIVGMMPDASRTAYSAGLFDGRYQPPYINTPGDPDAPSLMITQTWGIGRVIDALEADNSKLSSERLINVDPAKSAITGMSRMGKLALVAGAFEPRIAVVISSGSGGVVIDRFQSVAVNEEQSLGLEPSMGGDYKINKYYYYVKIDDKTDWDNTWRANAVLPAEALIDPDGRLDGGTTESSAYQDYDNYNDFVSGVKVAEGELNPVASGTNATATTGVGHGNNIKPGYAVINFGIQTGSGAEQGWHQ